MIDWKCIASRIYNPINEKNTIYLNFMNNINQKLSKVVMKNVVLVVTNMISVCILFVGHIRFV